MNDKISIIIPTFKRPESLHRTLSSLLQQDYDNYEVIIVDNAGEERASDIVRSFKSAGHTQFRYISFTQGGSSGARMAGVRASHGDILVFTDDDLTFNRNWLQAYADAFKSHSDMVAAGGRVKPVWEEPLPDWLSEYIGDKQCFPIFALIDLGDDFSISNKHTLYSCNMALRRSIFEWTGLRPELFGRKTIGSGESGLNQELVEKGKLIGYVPDAVSFHHIPKERMSISYIKKWAWHLGGTQMYMKWNGRRRTVLRLLSEYLGIIRQYALSWLVSLFAQNKTNPRAIDIQFKASLGFCKLNYVWWMFTDDMVKHYLDMNDFSL